MAQTENHTLEEFTSKVQAANMAESAEGSPPPREFAQS